MLLRYWQNRRFFKEVQNEILQPDLSLLRDYEDRDYALWPRLEKGAFVTHFFDDSREHNLYFVNGDHKPGRDSPSCRMVEAAVETFRPKFMVLEGFPTMLGLSPPSVVREAVSESWEKNFPTGEPTYSAYLADRKGIKFIGGEPDPRDLFQAMREEGYTTKEIMNFSLLSHITRLSQQEAQNFSATARKYWKKTPPFNRIPKKEKSTLEEFGEWFEQHNTTWKTYMQFDSGDLSPFGHPRMKYFRAYNRKELTFRDQNIDRLVGGALGAYKNVLIVYGGGHLHQSYRVFERMLGNVETWVASPNAAPDRPLTLVRSGQTPGL